MTNSEITTRVNKAQELFRQGFNCSQSVFAACADLFGIKDERLALRLSASFGGGIGRMRQTCGAACGMFLLEGLHSGSATPGDHEAKAANYAQVQALAQQFKEEHGSLICAELLGLAKVQTDTNPQPEARTETYYKKRPCVEMVGNAVRIFLNNLTV
ncbi:MAG: C_GCAxxG_C_C family protein [Paludibacteraceae bacterium]|nr:C_GCAxxG_C_C family protein [Paludibacteraceae bacterium]